jgi:thymidylate synthase
MDDKKITPAEQKAITEEAGAKMRELADSGKTVVTSNEFMADPSKVDIISLPSANEVFYLEKDPVKSVDRFKKKIATKDYIKALYNNPDIADKVTRASLQDMIMGEIKDNPIIQSIVKATDPQLVMTKIKAFFSMDEEARMSLFYNVNEEGEQIPYSEQEMVDLAKRVITKIEKNKEEREVLLSELDELLPTMTPETSITPEEKESVNTVVESGKDFDESQGTLRNLYDEAKTKTPEELREELLKKAGCKPDSNKAPF